MRKLGVKPASSLLRPASAENRCFESLEQTLFCWCAAFATGLPKNKHIVQRFRAAASDAARRRKKKRKRKTPFGGRRSTSNLVANSRKNTCGEWRKERRHSHVSVSPKARSSMSSSSSLASGSSSNTSPVRITWHVEQAQTPSQAPAANATTIRPFEERTNVRTSETRHVTIRRLIIHLHTDYMTTIGTNDYDTLNLASTKCNTPPNKLEAPTTAKTPQHQTELSEAYSTARACIKYCCDISAPAPAPSTFQVDAVLVRHPHEVHPTLGLGLLQAVLVLPRYLHPDLLLRHLGGFSYIRSNFL